MTLSPDQLARRLEGITATDVAAIIGANPYRSAIDVWREKRGEAQPFAGNKRTRWGDLVEPVIRRDYEERSGLRIDVPGTLGHPDARWQMCTPDGIGYDGAVPVRGLEIKDHTFRVAHLYGDPGTDEVPPWELVQCVWSMGVTGLSRWDLVAYIDNQPEDYIIDRDDELIEMLRERAERFLIDNVRGGAVPDPDGSESFDAWLKARHKANTDVLIDIGDDNDTFTLIERAKKVRAMGADLDDEHALIIQKLKLKIGENAGLTWKNGKGRPEKVTWKRSKATRKIDFAGIANDVRADARLALSAKRGEIERALICLKSAGDHAPIGCSARAAITAGEISQLVSVLQTTLDEINARTDAAYTIEIDGKRPFNFPKSWRAPREPKEPKEPE